eukprot:749210-Hanusia_phi.AAC.2
MAAAFIGAKRGRARAKEMEKYDVELFPEDEEVLLVGELQRQVMSPLGDTWQTRKVVLATNRLMMGKPGGSNVIDYIPLDEILDVVPKRENVEEKKSEGSKHGINISMRKSLKRVSHIKNEDVDDKEEGMFVITTIPNGHNSGRSTVFLASSPEESSKWVLR